MNRLGTAGLLLLSAILLPGCPGSPPVEDPTPAAELTEADADGDKDGLTNAMEVQIGTNPADPDTDGDGVTDGAELARGTDPLGPGGGEAEEATPADEGAAPAERAAPPADKPSPEEEYESLSLGTVSDSTEDSATTKLKRLCTNDFTISFRFTADDESDEWKFTLEDADDSTVTYVNLDDAENLEIGAPHNDFSLVPPAEEGSEHKVRIRYRQPNLSVSVNGKSIVSGHDVGSYDDCLHLKVGMHDGMVLTGTRVKYR